MKKIFRMMSVLMAVFMILSALPVTAAVASITDAKEGVVYIRSAFSASTGDEYIFKFSSGYGFLPAGSTIYGTGSGFAIGEVGQPAEYIITNAHVVLDETADYLQSVDTSGSVTYNSKKATEVEVYFSYGANEFMRAQIFMLNEEKDICVLKLPQPTDKRTPLVICRSNDMDQNDNFAALGFPASSTTYMDSTAIAYDMSDITITRGGISNASSTDRKGRSVYQLDINISPGNSGGPLVNSKGEVVGINTYSVTNYNGVTENYAIVIDELLGLINREIVPYTLSIETKGQERSPLMLIIIIAAVVLAIGIILFVVLSKKKKTTNMGGRGQVIPPPPVDPGVQFGGVTPMGGGSVPSGNAYIRGMKGVMTGQTFSINGNILMGRNAQKCNVAYPVDTKGISAVHCQIRSVGNGYEIIDRDSSNGTFLGSGQRLTPNVPTFLPDGTYFYLGSAEQLFQIKY